MRDARLVQTENPGNPGKEPVILIELYSLLPHWHRNTKRGWKASDASVTQLDEAVEDAGVVAGVGSCTRLRSIFFRSSVGGTRLRKLRYITSKHAISEGRHLIVHIRHRQHLRTIRGNRKVASSHKLCLTSSCFLS